MSPRGAIEPPYLLCVKRKEKELGLRLGWRSMLVSFRHRDIILCCETVVCLFVKSGYRRYRSFVLEIPCSPLLAHKGPVIQTINDYPLERTLAILKWPLELSNDTEL